MQSRVVIPYWCIGTTYQSHLKGSSQVLSSRVMMTWPLKMGPEGYQHIRTAYQSHLQGWRRLDLSVPSSRVKKTWPWRWGQ